jgi:hypothetical protein
LWGGGGDVEGREYSRKKERKKEKRYMREREREREILNYIHLDI